MPRKLLRPHPVVLQGVKPLEVEVGVGVERALRVSEKDSERYDEVGWDAGGDGSTQAGGARMIVW